MTSLICSIPLVHDICRSYYSERRGIVIPSDATLERIKSKIDFQLWSGAAVVLGSSAYCTYQIFQGPSMNTAAVVAGLFVSTLGYDMTAIAANLRCFIDRERVVIFHLNSNATERALKEKIQQCVIEVACADTIFPSLFLKITGYCHNFGSSRESQGQPSFST